jgi:predicted DNA-binding transcriptional regulator AlpA
MSTNGNRKEQPQEALDPKHAARYLGVGESTLRLWRSLGKGPRFFKAGDKLIRYRRTDLDSWIESRLSVLPRENELDTTLSKHQT